MIGFDPLDKPEVPNLTTEDNHPFVGENVTFTCASKVQRMPTGLPSSLTYTFTGRGSTQDNLHKILRLTKSDKGANISCRATDDLGKISNVSNTITLAPFCKYKSVTTA